MITVLLFYKMKSGIETDFNQVPFLAMGSSLYYVSKMTVSGSIKWLFLLTFSTVSMLIRRVGGVQKSQKIC